MVYLYNTETDTYKDLYRQSFNNLPEYLGEEVKDILHYNILFVVNIGDIFTQAKKRTALRGRFAKGKDGEALLDTIEMTDDDRSFIDDILPSGAAEVYKKMSAWSKNIINGLKYNVSFGVITASGTVISVDGAVITDTFLNLIASALKGQKLVITSGDDLKDQEREISDNTVTTITLASPFLEDITGLSYKTYNVSDKHILFSVSMDLNWDPNMLQVVDTAIKEALIQYLLKEWYLTNRYLPDAEIEDRKYQVELTKIRSGLMQSKVPYRRPSDMFS